MLFIDNKMKKKDNTVRTIIENRSKIKKLIPLTHIRSQLFDTTADLFCTLLFLEVKDKSNFLVTVVVVVSFDETKFKQ